MAEILEPDEFLTWFEDFMPQVNAREFLPLTTPVDTSEEPSNSDSEEQAADTQVTEPATEGFSGDEEETRKTTTSDEEQRRIDEETRALGWQVTPHRTGIYSW